MEQAVDQGINLLGRLRRAHAALAMIGQQPRDRPLRLSIFGAKSLLPTDIVNLCLVLEVASGMGFPSISLAPPVAGFISVYLWRIGFWDLFPQYAPRRPQREPGRGPTDRCIELTRFTDLAGAWELHERLPEVLLAATGAPDVPGGKRTLKRMSSAVFELAENTVAHSWRLTPGAGVLGFYMVQRMPKKGQTFIAIGDLGDGIPATMRARFGHLADDVAALRYAMEAGVSGSDGGGNGLAVAKRVACEIPGGAMTIESGGALLRIRADGSEKVEPWPGASRLTRISFKFNI